MPWDQRLARVCMRPLAGSPVTPNQVTAASLVAGLAAAWLYARGGASVHWGATFFLLSAWLDHADGELARLSGRVSRFGHYFDNLAGGLVLVLLFVGMGWGLSRGPILGWEPGLWAVGFGVAAGLATAVTFALRLELERRAGLAAIAQPALWGFEIEDTMYLVAPITWLGWHGPFLLAAGVGAPLFLLWQAWAFRRARAPRP
jgi:phosphatidylglycerophosphate synthase